MKHTLTLPDGTVVGSGAAGAAIQSVKLTASVNVDTELTPGTVAAAELDITLLGAVTIQAGDVLRLSGEGALLGTFVAEQPSITENGHMRLLAYDFVSRLDTDGEAFLAGVTFPITLDAFARSLCAFCGLTLAGTLENGDYAIAPFQARGVSCRQLLQWVCQAGCRFCRAQPDGTLLLDWYKDAGRTLGTGAEFVYQGGFACQNYTVAPVDGVRIALTDTDAGTCVPESAENRLSIVGNYLLTQDPAAVAQGVLAAVQGLAYTPATVLTNAPVAPGEIFRVTYGGKTHKLLAMTVAQSGGKYTVSCTGAANRTLSTSSGSSYRALAGRVLNLQWDLEGVKSQLAEFDDQQTRISQLSQDVDHITARVSLLQTGSDTMGKTLDELSQSAAQNFAQLQLQADGLSLAVGSVQRTVEDKADAEKVNTLAEHFRFGTDGMTITDSATGMAVRLSQEAVAFSGGSDDATRITPLGMSTTDLTVGRRLDVGAFSLIPRTSGNLSLRWTGENNA